ncbi:TIGR03619 family F420-dependent LLM class oxidoreductase [Nocardia sp. NPDC051833]|uniref:TIGR03619 family F420-dependent LLM class oxidoreductase n=1 Tax=Nocardia sp. NPDC051833 TaxID=3155674 RepID=UPI003432D4F4
MRIGIDTPVVTRVPGAHSPWEESAGIAELARIAVAADRLGFHHLTCSEHVAVPTAVAAVRGATYWDPLATLGYLAARTERIRLATKVLVLGYHHPLEIAKRYGTLDVVSGGRLVLGLGVGSLQEEFELLDVPFDDRGARADAALVALRAALSQRVPHHDGPYHRFSDLVVEPHAVQESVPLWVGGRTARSLRRAVDLADGWVPFGLTFDDIGTLLARREPPAGFEIVLSAGSLDPLGNPTGTRKKLAAATRAGATVIGAALTATSAEHYCDQLGALAEIRDEESGAVPVPGR